MNVLLLNPPAERTLLEFADESGDEFIETKSFGRFPPLGLLYVAASAEAALPHHRYRVLDCVAENISHTRLPEHIRRFAPDVVGMTSFTSSLLDVVAAARSVKQAAPECHLCMGGHHPMAFPFEAAALPDFDSIVVGEGEYAFAQLLERLEQGRDVAGIPGVHTRASIEPFRGAAGGADPRFLPRIPFPPACVEDIDALPPPARHHIRHLRYQSIVGVSNRLTTVLSSRGCPYRCAFCDVPYKEYRPRHVTAVADEVEACLRDGYREIHFYDDLFNKTPEKVLEFCDEIERRRLRFPWDFRGRVNAFTPEVARRARAAGCRMVAFGVETGSDEGLAAIHKGATTAQARAAFDACRRVGIRSIADFMIGFPFERSPADVAANLDFLMSLDADYMQIGVLCLYPHTQFHDDAVRLGLIPEDAWPAFARDPTPAFRIPHWEQHMSFATLLRLQRDGYRRYYLRPSYMLRHLLNIRSLHELRMKLRGLLQIV